jgi:replicative DNA helicase
VTEQNSKIVVIDSFEHLCDGFAENYHEETCNAIKSLAEELEVPVVVAALLTTQMHADGTNTPTMDGLTALDPLASLADVILFLHSEDYYHTGDPTYEQTGLYDLIIAKQSRGATGVVPLIFLRDISRFNSSSSLMPPE